MIDYNAFPEQRQSFIRQLLTEKGRVVSADLIKLLGVSEHTIRRDLQKLARDGVCKRVYGGAVSHLKQSATFETRINQCVDEKSSVAIKCAKLIKNNSCIFIDTGSTYLAMASYIPQNLTLTIVTNSPQIASVLSSRTNGELILLGGKVNPLTGGTMGADTVNQIRNMVFDQTFIGVCGLDPHAGLSAVYYDDACFKKEVITQSNEVIAAVIADKMQQVARYKVATCEDIDIIIASRDSKIEGFEDFNLKIKIA
ncbi:DeoR/GlpR transcriptional regulator [Gilliamella sp. B2717]|uniref:DeoR/GlpR family DNA-binding transcription regulator n=1 Tax=Gilliamella sp. B2717 TaxID=2817996 RepID=UPI0022698DD4|nr:DeoR/GlpR family DNA-binding transcription regulator [Gilliamella sp. B2717]MCX8578982.1 DeoR/GlpR transcriptional regulator [Gilliamella sp. B2717]